MAYEKAYELIGFVNGASPSLGATNLTKIDSAINTIDNRVIAVDEKATDAYDNSASALSGIAVIRDLYATKEEVTESIAELESEVAETYATKAELAEISETVTEIATEVSSGKADVILANAQGESIHLTDSTDSKAVEFALLGKATQNGTPTTEEPIDITVSGADRSVTVTTSNEDNTNSSTASISTPNGLAGINGVCDEIVKYADGTGQYIQRIKKRVFDGSETWYKSGVTTNNVYWITVADAMKSTNGNITYGMLCDRFIEEPTVYQWSNDTVSCAYGNPGGTSVELRIGMGLSGGINTVALFKEWLAEHPTTIYYRLAEPIVTELSAEEIAELEAVQTFYPTTNILNDANCGMEVTYKADTKNYIDKIIGERITALETALINNI